MAIRFDLDRSLRGRFRVEHAVHGSIVAVACVLRLAWLGHRPLHHDESIHAYYSWRILTMGIADYHYDPVYHGPTLYYFTALLEGLFGPSDFSARLLAVLTGLGLVALAWPLRGLIGRHEAIVYALLVTFSPTLGYYSRSLRHDVPIAFFTFAALIALLYFIQSGRRLHAYLAGAAIGLAAATKEDIYLSGFLFANALWMIGVVYVAGDDSPIVERAGHWVRDILSFLRRSWIPLVTGIVIALTIALVFYTSLLTHPREWNATSRALSYWWGQHEKQRIGGPWWYYLPLEVGYEGLIFFPALATLVGCVRRGASSRIEALFLLWSLLAFALYAWAQEKVPWLLVPVLVPQAVLAARALARAGPRALALCAPLAVLALWSLVASNYLYDALRTTEAPAEAHFEPLVYVQSTYDIPRILGEIEDVGRTLGTGEKTPMVVIGDATWPLSWYLRDYPVHWNSLPKETDAPLLIVDPADATRLEKDLGGRYAPQRFAVRGWWQIEWDRATLANIWRFLVYRRVWNPTGTSDAVMLVAKDLQAKTPLAKIALRPPPPARDYAGAGEPVSGRVIGGRGSAAGQFGEPRAINFDRQGNLLVADTQNNRIQKLDPQGGVLAVWGGPGAGEGEGQFKQPCGVAVAGDGSIYVADTWNHRIQKLDATGRFILQWREEEPALWGPRAVTVAPDGTVFVADTGNKRILAYDPGGQKLFAFGGEGNEPGQFVEPVGLAIDPETKTLYVADTGNHRVQSFDLQGKPRGAFPVFGWQEFYTEPYLAWGAGTLWATDSFNHRVNAYDASGTLVKSIDGGTGATRLGRPTGIALAPDGKVFVADLTEGRLVTLDVSLSKR